MLVVNHFIGFGVFAEVSGVISVTNIGTNSNSAGATVAITVPVGGVPSGALICFAVDENSGAAGGSVADTSGNTYNLVSTVGLNNDIASNGFGRFYYVQNATALSSGNSITWTKQVSGNQASVSAFYATGVATASALDASVTATAFGSSTTPTVTSGTPGQAGELFVGALWSKAGGTFTQDSGNSWAIPFNQGGATAATQVNGGNQVNAGSGTKTFAPTLSSSVPWSTGVWGFKPA